ncbi:MAG TPA: hypothetical protein VLU25_20935 [Acidobacteriota bacterium]|nr:hypothetical protein [Acidobacteriota bacterium]
MLLSSQFRAISLFLMLLLAALSAPAAFGQEDAEKDPAALADKLMEALGGQEAWNNARYIRFNFFGNRLHYWDKWTGRHRVQGKTRSGDEFVVLHNINTREGEAWVNGEKQEGEEAQDWLERAYGMWVNDTYWLVMPYKLKDPGVHLAYAGQEEVDGTTYDKVLLTFESGVGLTSGDRYWAYLNPDTGLMDRWAYILESNQDEDPEATVWNWTDWQSYGGIMLAGRRSSPDGSRSAELSHIAVYDQLPDSVFQSPDPVEGQGAVEEEG